MTSKPTPPPPGNDTLGELNRLISIVEILRSPQGCPWDRKQTLSSMKRNFLEEAAEVVDAIEQVDPTEANDHSHVQEELGDLLMNIFLASRIAEEANKFNLQQVALEICEKLIRRHPHVFGEDTIGDVDGVLNRWEEIKAQEKAQKKVQSSEMESILNKVPRSLPALESAQQLSKRAAKVGFDWPKAEGALEKVEEELEEVRSCLGEGKISKEKLREEIGDLLFSVVNLARKTDIDSGEALRFANQKFRRRFHHLEKRAGGLPENPQLSLERMEEFWQEAKEME